MRLILLFLALHFGICADSSENEDQENKEYIEEPALWIGPGLYYGIWFDNEEDYGEWQRNQRNFNRQNQEVRRGDRGDRGNRGDRGGRGGGGGRR